MTNQQELLAEYPWLADKHQLCGGDCSRPIGHTGRCHLEPRGTEQLKYPEFWKRCYRHIGPVGENTYHPAGCAHCDGSGYVISVDALGRVMATESMEGKTCSVCPHPAHGRWEWAPGHSGGYRCVCCLRTTWQSVLDNLTKSMKELPSDCEASHGD